VIVEECLAFILSHGLSCEGIYRQSGSAARINALLTRFQVTNMIRRTLNG
jgi:hypothetical protein